MKYILIPILFLILNGCSNNEVTISKTEYEKLKGITKSYPKPFTYTLDGIETYQNGITLGSDGHEYLLVNINTNSFNIEHYIECVKCAKRWKAIDSLLNLNQ